MLYSLCSDWSARYEVWSITGSTPHSMADIYIPLDAEEIYLQMKRSLWQNDPSWDSGSLKLQFPLAISQNVRVMAVLRTVFLFTPANGNVAKLEAMTLPLDFNKSLAARWPASEIRTENASVELTEQSSRLGFRTSVRNLLSPDKSSQTLGRSLSQGKAAKPYKSREPRGFRAHIRSRSQPGFDHELNGENIYTFWIFFSPDGRYLFFLDNASRTENNVAVFDIEICPRLRIYLAGHSKRGPLPEYTQIPQPRAVFHPQEPLVAYFFSMTQPVFLWGFKDGQ